jgi:hypothetical protein
MPGEGEIGCLFDEIQNLVEPIERSAMDLAKGGADHKKSHRKQRFGRKPLQF